MLFTSGLFVLFFAGVLLVHRALPPARRNGWLLLASFLFYGLWIPPYLGLLLAELVVNYALLRAIARHRSRWPLVASIGFTLGLLACFKYARFLLESFAALVGGLLPPDAVPALEILLPLGISFYSFQIIALAVDVARRRVEPPPSFARYALFVSFFPQLIAGPILRGGDFLPQLARGGCPTAARTRRGLWLLAAGGFKKVVLGDFLLAPFVDEVYGHPGIAPPPVQLVATWSFAFQIYFDFSGYTDIARGLACLLGYELPRNFREPYLSRNPAEFWRRWHITLSSWLRDYLYVPLGGNRHGRLRTLGNLAGTMVLGGLWHGAGWTFVAWGALQGGFLIAHRLLSGGRPTASRAPGLRDAWRVLLCFHAMCLGWVFFRADSLDAAGRILARIATPEYHTAWPVLPTLCVLACGLLHGGERALRPRLPALRRKLGDGALGGAIEGLAFGALAAAIFTASGPGAEFIYFQF